MFAPDQDPGSVGGFMIRIHAPALIPPMSTIDAFGIDGHLLRLLVAVHEEGSITRAAERLGVTQSAVSHQLERLRAIVGDELFVRAGRGIAPTARAEALAARARVLLEDLQGFVQVGAFEPARAEALITIAANELQRDLLLPPLLARLRQAAPGITLRIVPSGVPGAGLLREGGCDLVITPRPPDAPDVLQRRLFEDRYVVFHDANVAPAPADLAAYQAAEHVTVVHERERPLDIDGWLAARGVQRRFVVTVPNFGGVAPFLLHSPRIATLPSGLAAHLLRGLGVAPVPVACPPMPMFLLWHRRHQHDPLRAWLRAQLLAVAEATAAARTA
jgi:DNA-binding transcriptional LysR family regulator